MAAATMPPGNGARDDQVMDTRTPSPLQKTESGEAGDGYKGELSSEVSLLSAKLVNAINYQTNLDDSLQQTRHDLEQSRNENARLRAEKKSLDDMIANGLLVRKSFVDKTVNQLRIELSRERMAKEDAEKSRKQTENELENLTTALFEEANTMVAAARKDTEAVEKRNSQLKSQIKDTELLLMSQQEQLQDLKLTMEKMSERGEPDNATARDSMPSTPIGSSGAVFDALQLSPNGSNIAETAPEHPLYFSQLLTPVLRNDVVTYVDFQDLLKTSRQASGHSRAGSSSHSTSSLTSSSTPNLSTNSSPALPGAFSFSVGSSPQSANFVSTAPPLKDSKFYKRALAEDLEPTLRLDLAPGLSFLSRRTVLSSLLQGSMVVEPFMPAAKFYGPVYACALCGEGRKNEPFVRKHRFRTSEEESAQRYPLCDYCLGRIRAAGDFVGFLRMVRDGHWRAESEEEVKGAWEEAVRLRERMFWARIGGGVVPNLAAIRGATPSHGGKSTRASLESVPEETANVPQGRAETVPVAEPEVEVKESREPVHERLTESEPEPEKQLLDVFRSHKKTMSLSRGAEDAPTASTPAEQTPQVDIEAPAAASQLSTELDADAAAASAPVEATPAVHVTSEETIMVVEPAAPEPAATEPTEPTTLEPATIGSTTAETSAPEPSAAKSSESPASDPTQPKPPPHDPSTIAPPPVATATDPETLPAMTDSEPTSSDPNTQAPDPTETPTTAGAPPPRPRSPSLTLIQRETDPASLSVPGSPSVPTSPTSLASPDLRPGFNTERRPSAVLARVREMEAKAQGADEEKKIPGGFD